jgi:hypothetical protein
VQAADFLIKEAESCSRMGVGKNKMQTLLDEAEALFLSTKGRQSEQSRCCVL